VSLTPKDHWLWRVIKIILLNELDKSFGLNNYILCNIRDINGICECMDCNANATSRVLVKVGDKGQITLFLCEKCRLQFSP
jgi:hypothetical protein